MKVFFFFSLFVLLVSNLCAQNRELWVSSSRVAELRTLVQEQDTHHQRAFLAMKAYVDENSARIISVPSRLGSNWNYDRSYLAQQAALTSLLSSDTVDRQQYADLTYSTLRAMYDDPDSGGHLMLGDNQHLSKATVAMGFVMGLEWASEMWTTEQTDWVKSRMMEALDGWASLGHTNFGGDYSSNWLAVVRGAEICLMLSLGEQEYRPLRYRTLREALIRNANTHGERGWGQEGNFYLSFGQIFAIPAMLAMENIGDPEMSLAISQKQLHMVPLYGSMFSESFDSINWGVGGSIWDGGFASLTMAITPEGEKPYIRWWYDRFMGVLNSAPDNQKFDKERQGRIWSILYYPEDAEPADPGLYYPVAIEDTGGFYLRSGWQGTDNVAIYLGTDKSTYSPGWNAPDAFSIVVLGQENRYITGPGNSSYLASSKDMFSTILVDDAVPEAHRNGSSQYFGLNEKGAYSIAGGGSAYTNLGLSSAERHLLTDFSRDSGQTALLGLYDKLRSAGSAHEYRWQINTSSAQVDLSYESGRPTFTITYPGNNGYLKGWVVHPANANLQTGAGRLFFNTTSVNSDIWVVMAVGDGDTPSANISGTDLNSMVSINGVTVSHDTATGRLSSSSVQFTSPPVASFSATPVSGSQPLNVTVNASGSSSPAGITDFAWDFGDGTTATGISANHSYNEPGLYRISLKITDAQGRNEVANRTIVVGTRWPSAAFSVSPNNGQPPLEVTIDPSASFHPNGLPMTYEWDLGDGTVFTRNDNRAFTHTFAAGTHRIRLVLRDSNGGFDARETSVSVVNRAPSASVNWSIGGGEAPLTVQFSAYGSTEPDGDPVTYLWDFGDGTTSTEFAPTHTYTNIGNFPVTLTVSDDKGASGSATLPSNIQVREPVNLLPATDPATLPDLLRGLDYSAFNNEGQTDIALNTDLLTFIDNGITDNFNIWHRAGMIDRFSLRYDGFIDVPFNGVYTFYVSSRNGVSLSVSGQELVQSSTRWGTVNQWITLNLSAGLHPLKVVYFGNENPNGPFEPYLELAWSGPGFGIQGIGNDQLYWVPGRPFADFVFSKAPDSPVSPVVYNFDASSSLAFEGAVISNYEWEFPGNVIKTGRTVSHAFSGANQKVILRITTSDGSTATTSKTVTIRQPEDYEEIGGIDRGVLPGRIVRARGEFSTGLAEWAFDGDRSTRWLDVGTLVSWIEIELQNNGIPTPYVISEYRFTSLTLWNDRDPYSWKLYASNDGEEWTLLDEVTGNVFPKTSHPRINSFPLPENTTAYSYYRFEDVQATGPSSAPDAVGLNQIELIDYGLGDQPASSDPTTEFTISNSSPSVGQSTVFNGAESADPEGYPLYFSWDFGDGQSLSGWELYNVEHTYYSAGSFTAKLTVRDALGSSSNTTRSLTVSVVSNADPVADYSMQPFSPTGYTQVLFDASTSFDPDGDPITYHWDFGDGSTSEGAVVQHGFAVGKYTPVLTVIDDRRGLSTHALELIVPEPEEPPLSIGINFSSSKKNSPSYLWPNEVAGLVPQNNWNNLVEPSVSDLKDSNGEATSLSFSRSGNGYDSQTIPRSADHRLMVVGAGGVHSFVNVPYAEYDVYVYHSARREDQDRDISWPVTLMSESVEMEQWQRNESFAWNGEYSISEATSPTEAVDGQNVIVFRGLKDRNFTLRADSHQRRTLAHAIQIVDASGGTIVPPINPPAAPQNLVSTSMNSSTIRLSWDLPVGIVEGFKLERAAINSESWIQIANIPEQVFAATELTPDSDYKFRVRAYNSGGESPWSAIIIGSTLPMSTIVPDVPTGLTTTATTAISVFVQWNAVDSPVEGYVLERAAIDVDNWIVLEDGFQLSFNDDTLLPGTSYRYRVMAYNEAGPSAWSPEASVTTPGEFGNGQEVPIVIWGEGQYAANSDTGIGFYLSLPGSNSGTSMLNGQETGYTFRPFGASAVTPGYNPEPPPSGRFNAAFAIFNSAGNTSSPTTFFRLDGRIDSNSVSELQIRTTTSSSSNAVNMIWWEKEDFLFGYDQESLATAELFVKAKVNKNCRVLIKNRGSWLISQSSIADSAMNLSAQAWAEFDPSADGAFGIFASKSADSPLSAAGLLYSPRTLDDVEALGLYFERIDSTDNRSFYLKEFRVIAVLPDDSTPTPGSFAAWQVNAGFSASDLDNPSVSGPEADPLESGISNLERHAFGMQWDTPTAGWLPTLTYRNEEGSMYLHFNYKVNTAATDIQINILQSSNLLEWLPINEEWSTSSSSFSTTVDDIELSRPWNSDNSEPLFLILEIHQLD